MNNLNRGIEIIILTILGVSTIITVCDFIGMLPRRIRKRLRLNKADDTLEVIKEFGINVDLYKRNNLQLQFPKLHLKDDIKNVVLNELNKMKIKKKIAVGRTRTTQLDYYIDLIGKSCDEYIAKGFAQYLSTYMAENIKNNKIRRSDIDFIVTPKGGSPILGYEFSKVINKPLVLHELSSRFQNNKQDFRAYFNCYDIPRVGAVALIVDDSTTGGTMVIDTINHLREFGYVVEDCLVVFEPKSKDAREKLMEKGVNLISIVETHDK